MFKKRLIVVFCSLFIAFCIPALAQTSIKTNRVDYILPYPGMTPDSPFYIFKKTRDNLLVFFTRDNIKKAEVLLQISDKKIQMSKMVSERGKWKLSIKTASEAEENTSKTISVLKTAKKQGSTAPAGFLQQVDLSIRKHQEIIEDLLIKAPSSQRNELEESLKINNSNQKSFSKL